MNEEAFERYSAVKGGFFKKNFSKSETLTLVLKTGIAGLYYKLSPETDEKDKALLQSLAVGTQLKLYRDVNNIHDKFAIIVCTLEGKELGYITRFKNETIARLMDLGREFKAFVGEKPDEPEDEIEERRTVAVSEDYTIPIDIFMVEI